MWKRHEIGPKDNEIRSGDNDTTTVLSDTTNTSHSVKRLRLKAATESLPEGKENRPAKYLATLRDEAKETPKRETSS